jgi:threonine dehydratase
MPARPTLFSADDLEFVTSRSVTTPIRTSPLLDARLGRAILSKDETVQRGGSFKFRGALLGVRNAVEGVVAAGSGNFPIAVGLAAQMLGKRACLVIPSDAPAFKLEQARRTGAEIKTTERSSLVDYAQAEAERRGWNNLHAFESIEMIAGSATLGSEIAVAIREAGPASDAVIVACGGGGLASGVAMALRSHSIDAAIYVAEPETHRRYAAAHAAGAPVRIEPSGNTICDALQPRQIGRKAFEILEHSNVRICSVSDAAVSSASDLLWEACRITAEPSGALAMGAVLNGSIGPESTRLWVIACGGNVDPSINETRRA